MIVDVAMKEPRPRVVGQHVDFQRLAGQEAQRIQSTPRLHPRVAVPVHRVQVGLVPEAEHVPADALPRAHRHHGEIAVHGAVDGVQEVALHEPLVIEIHALRVAGPGPDIVLQVGRLVLVVDLEQCHELAVHVDGGSVWPRTAPGRHQDRSDQAGIGVADRVDVGVIGPRHRAEIARARARALGNRPHVDVGARGRDRIVEGVGARRTVRAPRALGVLGVEDAVRVHAEGEARAVVEDDPDRVADHPAEDRTQRPQVLPLGRHGCWRGERAVGVGAVQGLGVDPADPVGPRLDEHRFGLAEVPVRQPVLARRRVVPVDLLGRQIVRAGAGSRVVLRQSADRREGEERRGERAQRAEHPETGPAR